MSTQQLDAGAYNGRHL